MTAFDIFLIAVVSFVSGVLITVILLPMCAAASEFDENMGIKDVCNGCFGADNGDCDHCPVSNGDEDENRFD